MDALLRKFEDYQATGLINILLILLSAFFISSCEKQTLEKNIEGDANIYFQAMFNGTPVSYKAGFSSIYASRYRSLDKKDSMLTYVFSLADIHNQSKRYIEIAINNFRAPYQGENDINSTIIPGNFQYFPKPGNPKHPSEVIIYWYNENQEFYTTTAIDQNGSNFTINTVKDTVFYFNGEELKLKKVNLTFRCRLINITKKDTVFVTNGQAVIVF
jgi:hypothetical protein